jgi:hypothetical protein
MDYLIIFLLLGVLISTTKIHERLEKLEREKKAEKKGL